MEDQLTPAEAAAKAKLLGDPRVELAELDKGARKPAIYVALADGWQFDGGTTIVYEDTWAEALDYVESFAERNAAA